MWEGLSPFQARLKQNKIYSMSECNLEGNLTPLLGLSFFTDPTNLVWSFSNSDKQLPRKLMKINDAHKAGNYDRRRNIVFLWLIRGCENTVQQTRTEAL